MLCIASDVPSVEVVVLEAVLELLVLFDADPVDELEALEELAVLAGLADGGVGLKVVCPTPKPMADASVPVPPIVMNAVSFLPVITSWPRLFSDAVTCALVDRFTLRASIRSPTVSVPVERYVVVVRPVVTVILPPERIPRLASEVFVESGAVPVATAGAPAVLLELEDPEEPELEDDAAELPVDDEVELPEGCKAACTAATNSEFTRLRAVPLAMLAKPFA